jgi:hypothetical protein
MAILVAAIGLVGLLCLADLLLTFGVIRRLREHTEQLAGLRGQDAPVSGLPYGAAPEPFTALTARGEPVHGPAGLRVVAFFAAGCSACPERVPAFLDYLRVNQVMRDAVLAVITNSRPEEPVSYQERLAEAAPVCVEPHDGEVSTAFNVRAFPAFCVLDGTGSVKAFSHEPAALPALAAAGRS